MKTPIQSSTDHFDYYVGRSRFSVFVANNRWHVIFHRKDTVTYIGNHRDFIDADALVRNLIPHIKED